MMRPFRLFVGVLLLSGFVFACGKDEVQGEAKGSASSGTQEKVEEVRYEKVDGVAVDMENKGIGPIKSLTLGSEIDEALAARGKEVYDINCMACHKTDKKFVGPSPKGILERRSPEWVMNMILNPEEMVAKDPIAKQLLLEYNGAQMANQNIGEENARAVLEYIRSL